MIQLTIAGIWQFVSRLVGEYVAKYGTLSVTMGPAFDGNFDSLADTNGINKYVHLHVTLT